MVSGYIISLTEGVEMLHAFKTGDKRVLMGSVGRVRGSSSVI